MADIKQPQDRKPKAVPFRFTHGGKTFSLPFASESGGKVAGRIVRDAVMAPDDEAAQMRLNIAMLEVSEAPKAAVDALYEKPALEMFDVINEWMEHGDGKGTSAPKS